MRLLYVALTRAQDKLILTVPLGMTKTGKVATFGGIQIPSVTVFMDGFADGVAAYNKAKGHERAAARLGQGFAERLLHAVFR